jgi:hypothetical protein
MSIGIGLASGRLVGRPLPRSDAELESVDVEAHVERLIEVRRLAERLLVEAFRGVEVGGLELEGAEAVHARDHRTVRSRVEGRGKRGRSGR